MKEIIKYEGLGLYEHSLCKHTYTHTIHRLTFRHILNYFSVSRHFKKH